MPPHYVQQINNMALLQNLTILNANNKQHIINSKHLLKNKNKDEENVDMWYKQFLAMKF